MSKIAEFQKAKNHLTDLRMLLAATTDKQCDKFGGDVGLTGTYQGYYGNSSCSEWKKECVTAVAAQLSGLLNHAIGLAVAHAERQLEAARKAAEAEAREVLQEVEVSR